MTSREILLIVHFLGLAISLGAGFSMTFLMATNSKLDEEESMKFSARLRPLMFLAPTGLLMLIISGLFLLMPLWAAYKTEGLLHVKITIALVILIISGILHMMSAKARRTGKIPKSMNFVSKLPLLLGIIALILAVIIFQ